MTFPFHGHPIGATCNRTALHLGSFAKDDEAGRPNIIMVDVVAENSEIREINLGGADDDEGGGGVIAADRPAEGFGDVGTDSVAALYSGSVGGHCHTEQETCCGEGGLEGELASFCFSLHCRGHGRSSF